MAGMGPPPKRPEGRRKGGSSSGLTGAVTYLPAEGRQFEAPRWPYDLFLDGEHQLWRDLWATPQAAAWDRLGAGTVRVVARYVRLSCRAEGVAAGKSSLADAQVLGEVRQLEDRLGLSPMAMLRLRWEVVADEVAEARAGATGIAPAERRIRAVE